MPLFSFFSCLLFLLFIFFLYIIYIIYIILYLKYIYILYSIIKKRVSVTNDIRILQENMRYSISYLYWNERSEWK